MENIEKELLNEALELLGEVLAQRGHTSENFVVCGGSSLMAIGFKLMLSGLLKELGYGDLTDQI